MGFISSPQRTIRTHHRTGSFQTAGVDVLRFICLMATFL